ncbi:MAG: hypothetical protein WC299_14005 [Kiritimatiellia bacterium]
MEIIMKVGGKVDAANFLFRHRNASPFAGHETAFFVPGIAQNFTHAIKTAAQIIAGNPDFTLAAILYPESFFPYAGPDTQGDDRRAGVPAGRE